MPARLFVKGFATYVPPVHTAPLRFPSDRLLRSVHLPVQVILAGNTVHDSAKGRQRIQAVVPDWRYHLCDASYASLVEVPGEVNACIRQFVIEHRTGA
jgi:hypothetical protein